MDKFGLIGFPITHSLSPRLFEAAYGGRYRYDLIENRDFEDAWKTFTEGDWKAVNVTAPFKESAFLRADYAGDECRDIGAANILIKTADGIEARNSDYLAVKSILTGLDGVHSAAVIGYGGAGKAALKATRDSGLDVSLYRHDGISSGVSADVIIYTLPCAVEGINLLTCRHLLEANYKVPCLASHPGYISGRRWLLEQAIIGYPLMTGLAPSRDAMTSLIELSL